MKSRTTHPTERRSTWGWTPQEHVRTALHLLGELDNELRVEGSLVPGRHYPVRLLAATRRQLWLAMVALDSRSSSPSWWAGRGRVGHKRGWAATILLEVVACGGVAIGFARRWVWWYTRAALRVLWRS